MVPVTFSLQLLLVVLILRQSAAASDQCSDVREDMYALERDIVRITEQKKNYEIQAGNCQVSGYIESCGDCKLVLLLNHTHESVSSIEENVNSAVTIFDSNICAVRENAKSKSSYFVHSAKRMRERFACC
jgi:hypothetical protein